MLRRLEQINYTTTSFIFLAVFLLNHYVWANAVFGVLVLVFFFAFYGARLGWRFLPDHKLFWRTALGALTLLSSIIIIGTLLYYIAFLPSDLWVIIILLTPIAVWLLTPKHPKWRLIDIWRNKPHRAPRSTCMLAAIAAILFVAIFSLLRNVDIFDAVRSPWERIPTVTIWIAALIFFIIVFLAIRGRERSITLSLVMAATLLSVSVAMIVYPLGFGFDSFLHQATELHISQYGTIDPKPFYYIGQYVSVLFTSQAFQIPLTFVDRVFLPLLTAFFLPIAWFFASASIGKNKRSAMFSTLGLFLLPLSTFIVTTPQGLANLWTLLLVLLSLPYLSSREGLRFGALTIIAVAVLAIHPLSGIPALLYLVLIGIRSSKIGTEKARNSLFWLGAALGSIALPAIFVFNSVISGLELNFNFSALSPINLWNSLNIGLIFQSGFNTFLDFVYLFRANALLLLVIVAIVALWHHRKKMPRDLWLPAVMVVVLIVNYVILSSAVEFNFLIDYERSNYSARLITLIFFFLSPYLALFLMLVHEKISERGLLPKVMVGGILVALLTSQFYLFYPRRDNYETSHGFNMGAADLLAVEHINNIAPDDFVVLANQQVSAASVLRFGFKQYYGDVFYYPIPTGGELYQLFLEMSERPTDETIEKAMDLAEVDTAFFVINNYWWQAPRLIETAKTNADDWIALDGGRVHVFQYNR